MNHEWKEKECLQDSTAGRALYSYCTAHPEPSADPLEPYTAPLELSTAPLEPSNAPLDPFPAPLKPCAAPLQVL